MHKADENIYWEYCIVHSDLLHHLPWGCLTTKLIYTLSWSVSLLTLFCGCLTVKLPNKNNDAFPLVHKKHAAPVSKQQYINPAVHVV